MRESGPDLVLPDGTVLEIKRRALYTEDDVERLVAGAQMIHHAKLFVVADRITDSARRALVRNGVGYLDLRGHLALRAPGLVIDSRIAPLSARSSRKDPLSGKVGLEVATLILLQRSEGSSVREMARSLERAPSTVSEVTSGLRASEVIDEKNRPVGDSLFWLVADKWPVERTYLRGLPPQSSADRIADSLRMGLAFPEQTAGWAATDSAAALSYGAPVALRSDHLVDFYVPDRISVSRAITLLGQASGLKDARCSVRKAPVPAACRMRTIDQSSSWPLAQPLFVALDLAQDKGRGREILDAWEPPAGAARVW